MNGSFAESPEALDERCAAFVELHVWPLFAHLDWKGWLANFVSDEERYFARCLLEAFLYYNGGHSNALYRAAFHNLSRTIVRAEATSADGAAAWGEFLQHVIVTHVEGENPSPTDSGWGFVRGARTLLGISEARILVPAAALDVVAGAPQTPIVFVDDILGSGKQLESMWLRDYGRGYSFSSVAASETLSAWYIPLLATEVGLARVVPLTAGVTIAPAHILTARYSALHPDSLLWRPGEHESGREFVEHVSIRAGFSASDCWGFHRLALAVGVQDSIPDASLPLFYSERNGWRPLMRRR